MIAPSQARGQRSSFTTMKALRITDAIANASATQ